MNIQREAVLDAREAVEARRLSQDPPLVVDLDGTLLRSDLLLETALEFLRDHPLRFFQPLRWLARGKAALKQGLADATDLDVAVLPYNDNLLAFIRNERARGRRIVLATASHRRLADRVLEHLPLFEGVIATEKGGNLAGAEKRDALVAAFGVGGFDYAGNYVDDLPVWRSARRAYVVNAPPSIELRARHFDNVAAVMPSPAPTLRDWVRGLRLHQWLKNLLLFVPLVAAHRYTEVALVIDALVAFVCFGLCASSVYVLNDLLDLRDDRHHPRKRLRPFASGRMSVGLGLAVFPCLLLMSFMLAAWQLSPVFLWGLATYYGVTLAYSLALKRYMVLDVITLATLYTLRIIVGAVALGIALSFWLLAFSMFMFLSLALVKRYAELQAAQAMGSSQRNRGRGYLANDLHMIAALGGASGYMAVMVLALYINDPDIIRFYSRPEAIWLACPLILTWISRVWMLADRGRMNEDPVVFALRDRMSLLTGAFLVLVFWAAA